MPRFALLAAAAAVALAFAATACGGDDKLTIYSGRSEDLVGPIIEQFEEDTGIDVEVRYSDTPQTAALLVEEGEDSPADIFWAQDAGGLGAVDDAGLLAVLPASILDLVDDRFQAPDGKWVGVSGRARTIVYNTEMVDPEDIPDSVHGLTDPEWEGRVGWAPTNGSFQSFITAMRVLEGDGATTEWLEAMLANGVEEYPNNVTIVEAVAAGEIEVGLVNHYYLFQFLAEQGEGFGARQVFSSAGDASSLVNAAGLAMLTSSSKQEDALAFIEWMLGQQAQEYFSNETYEYPLAAGVQPQESLPLLEDLNTPDVDLGDLDDLEGTQDLLRAAGVIP